MKMDKGWLFVLPLALYLLFCVVMVSEAFGEERNITYSKNFKESLYHDRYYNGDSDYSGSYDNWRDITNYNWYANDGSYNYGFHDYRVFKYEQTEIWGNVENDILVLETNNRPEFDSALICNWVVWC